MAIFSCTICGEYFWDLDERKKHALRSHNDCENRVYLCDTCGQEFSEPNKYDAHRRTHMPRKQRPVGRTYECYLCKAHFCHKKSCIGHMWKHAPLNRWPYMCNLCGGKFTRLMSLRRHTLIHTGQNPFVCDVCGKGFRTKTNMTVSSLFKNVKKPIFRFSKNPIFKLILWIQFFVMNYSANLLGSFQVHYRIHTGEKPYACTICDYRSTDGPNLNKHMLQKHRTTYFKKVESK